MAIFKCPSCGNDVSDYSQESSKCGEPIHFKVVRKKNLKREMTSYFITVIIASIITVAAGTVCFFVTEINFYLEITIMANIYILIFTIKAIVLWQKININ